MIGGKEMQQAVAGTTTAGKRLAILVLCSVLSLPGMLAPLLLLLYALRESIGCMGTPARACLNDVGLMLAYVFLAGAAWALYFRMGRAWVAREGLSPRVPALGCVLGFLAATLGGLAGWRPVGALFALPAAVLACWLTGYHWWAWAQCRRRAR